MVWWHKPRPTLAPDRNLAEAAGWVSLPWDTESRAGGCFGFLSLLVVTLLSFWGCHNMSLEVKTVPVLCRFSLLLLASFLCLQAKGFSGKCTFWKHVVPVILGFDPFSFPFFPTVIRTSPNEPSSSHQSCTTNSLPLFSLGGVAMAAAALGIMILSWQSKGVHTSGKVWLVCWWGGRWLRGDSTQVKVSWEISLDFPVP